MLVFSTNGRNTRPTYWTRRPLKANGKAKNSVSSGGQSKPSPSRLPVATRRSPRSAEPEFELLHHRRSLFLGHTPVEDEWLETEIPQCLCDALDVLGPLGEDETVPPLVHSHEDVATDLPRSLAILDDASKDFLDPDAVRLWDRVAGAVNDQLQACGGGGISPGPKAMTDWAAVHGDKALQAVPSVGRGRETEPPSYG